MSNTEHNGRTRMHWVEAKVNLYLPLSGSFAGPATVALFDPTHGHLDASIELKTVMVVLGLVMWIASIESLRRRWADD